jgi:hypothetical protein
MTWIENGTSIHWTVNEKYFNNYWILFCWQTSTSICWWYHWIRSWRGYLSTCLSVHWSSEYIQQTRIGRKKCSVKLVSFCRGNITTVNLIDFNNMQYLLIRSTIALLTINGLLKQIIKKKKKYWECNFLVCL